MHTNRKHIDKHLKPHRCRVRGCADISFATAGGCLRHEQEAHGMHVPSVVSMSDEEHKRLNCRNGGRDRALYTCLVAMPPKVAVAKNHHEDSR